MSAILAIGGAHVDRRGRLAEATVPGASNPGRITVEEPGGGVFNVARLLAGLGHAVRLVAPRGGDGAGAMVAAAARAAGIDDRPLTFLDRRTPSYTAILDRHGDLFIALADMALYERVTPRQIARRAMREAIAECDAVIADANLPADTLAALAAACRTAGRPLHAIAISPAKVVRLKAVLAHLDGLYMNCAEAAALCGRPGGDAAGGGRAPDWPARLAAIGLARGAVTAGRDPVAAFEPGSVWCLSPPPVPAVADVTGAGDALAAGLIDGRLGGGGLDLALRQGVAAAGLALASASAVPHDLDRARLAAALAGVPRPERRASAPCVATAADEGARNDTEGR